MQERDLGPLGETEFRRLCHSVGLTIHKSEMDRTGWDFLIEFPWSQKNFFPRDLLLAPLECKIQVKSTDKKRKRESITLSNLNRLVKTQIPAFFCFMEFDGEDQAQSVYLVHIGKEIIERTLKRIRELESEGCADKLNQHTLDIVYGDANKLASLTGIALKSAIEKNIPNGIEDYIKNKNQILETVGFEDGKYQVRITIISNDPIRDVLDVTLGLREEIEIHQAVGYHTRFGILLNNPEITHDRGVISIYTKPVKAKLKFKENKFSLGISFAAKLHISPFTRFIPKEHAKFRIESKFFDIILESDRINYTVRLYPNEKVSLRELVSFLELLSMFEKSTKPIMVEMETEDINPSPILNLNASDFPSELFEISACSGQISTWSAIADLAVKIIEVCKKIQISEEDVLVQIEDLLTIHQQGSFALLYQTLFGNAGSVIVYFPDDLDGLKECKQSAKAANVSFLRICIGNYVIGYCLGVVGSLSLLAGQQTLIGEEFFLGQQFIKADGAKIAKENIELGLNELVEELQKRDLVAVVLSPL